MTESAGLAQVAQTGFAAASAYDQHRPSYPPEAVDEFLSVLNVQGVKHAKVLDLAAGTGKFTEILAWRDEGYNVTAVEPHSGMRDVLEKKALPNVKVLDGTAENMGGSVSDESVDAVVVAQAFHWISNMTALKEIHRVLRGTAVLGMIWNVEDYNAPREWDIHAGWESTLRDVIWSLEDNHPRFRHQTWKKVFDEQNAGNPAISDPLFGLPLGENSVDRTVWLSKEDVWKRFRTLSQVAVLEGDELKRVEKIFWDAINEDTTEVNSEGRVAVHVRTHFAWTSKIPDVPLLAERGM